MIKNQLSKKKENILATLVWFSLRGRSLSLSEIVELQYKSTFTELEIEQILNSNRRIQKSGGGLYSLFLDQTKKLSEAGYARKWEIAQRGARILRFVPYIKMVAVVNSLADKTAHSNSDIDFFIVTSSNRLFTCRLLTTIALNLFRLRRSDKMVSDHICLSFFITTKALDLSQIAIDSEDVYLAYWITQLQPLINYDNTYNQFMSQNKWVESIVPGYANQRFPKSSKNEFVKFKEFMGTNFIGNYIESRLRNWQLKRINNHPRSASPDVEVVANRDMLKFHMIDRRRQYRDKWRRLVNLISN